MSKKTGVDGVLLDTARAIAADLERAGLPAEQLDLLAVAPDNAVSPADARRILNSEASGAGVEVRKGRKKNSQNVLTKKVKEVIMATIGDPALARLRYVYHRTPQQLARELGCKTFEAAQFQDRILESMQGMFHAKAAQLDDEGKPIPQLHFEVHSDNRVAVVLPQGAKLPPWLTDAEVAGNVAKQQQNQGVTIDATAQSHDQSHTKQGK